MIERSIGNVEERRRELVGSALVLEGTWRCEQGSAGDAVGRAEGSSDSSILSLLSSMGHADVLRRRLVHASVAPMKSHVIIGASTSCSAHSCYTPFFLRSHRCH